MDVEPKAIHKGVVITYIESENRWEFEIYGKERYASTLALAREAINKPAPKDKKEIFKPVEVHMMPSWYDDTKEPEVVTITSIADSPSWRDENKFWVKHSLDKEWPRRGERTKESQSSLLLINDNNKRLLELIRDNRLTQTRLCKEREQLLKQLQHPVAPKKGTDESNS